MNSTTTTEITYIIRATHDSGQGMFYSDTPECGYKVDSHEKHRTTDWEEAMDFARKLQNHGRQGSVSIVSPDFPGETWYPMIGWIDADGNKVQA